jgi:hypothetical protein
VAEDRKEVMNTESNGITITNMCYQCQALTELCPDCQELKDSRDIDIAHQIVDEGNLQYKHVWSQTETDVTGHDWVGSITKLVRPAIQLDGSIVEDRYEFLDAISVITDRIYDLETSVTVTANETLCGSCHLVYNKYQQDCPVCY